jgi:hypothetical protein
MEKLTCIIVMALVTYILLSTLIAGLKGQFKPELLGYTATTGMVVVIVEIVALKLGCYLLSISSQSQLLDLIAYSGYKFVGIIVTIAVAEILNGGKGTGGWIGWVVFLYTFLANSLFLVRLVLPNVGQQRVRRPQKPFLANALPRCGLCDTSFCLRRPATLAVLCRPIPAQSATNALSSSSSTRTLFSSSSCGCSPWGSERKRILAWSLGGFGIWVTKEGGAGTEFMKWGKIPPVDTGAKFHVWDARGRLFPVCSYSCDWWSALTEATWSSALSCQS